MKQYLRVIISLLLALLLFGVPIVASAQAHTTFEDDFKTWQGDWTGHGSLRVQLQANTMTIEYQPVFYFDNSFAATAEAKEQFVTHAVNGFQAWAGTYDIRGRELTVAVNVYPSISTHRRDANVRVLPPHAFLTSMVPASIVWFPRNPFMVMYLRMHHLYPDRHLEILSAHEFAHKLGIFDAYGYGTHIQNRHLSAIVDALLPGAPLERAAPNNIMYFGDEITSTELEMILWAWSRGRLQLYTASILCLVGAEVSHAFRD